MTLTISEQAMVQISTLLILALSVVLAAFLTLNYTQRRTRSYLFWSTGLWLFALGVLEEFLFSSGYYSEFMINFYLGITALLVELLALGSISLLASKMAKSAYYVFSALSALALLYVLGTETVGNILVNHVVYGALPLGIVSVSSVITFPAAFVLIVTAALTYRRTKNRKMLSIIAGVAVVSIAGSLYLVQFPAFLYYSEFIGILLLWLGFFDVSPKRTLRVLEYGIARVKARQSHREAVPAWA
jgi:hypothetical protein